MRRPSSPRAPRHVAARDGPSPPRCASLLSSSIKTDEPILRLLPCSRRRPHARPQNPARSLAEIHGGRGGGRRARAGGGVRRARAGGGRHSRGPAVHRAGLQPPPPPAAEAAAAGAPGDPLVGPAPPEEGPGGRCVGREARGRRRRQERGRRQPGHPARLPRGRRARRGHRGRRGGGRRQGLCAGQVGAGAARRGRELVPRERPPPKANRGLQGPAADLAEHQRQPQADSPEQAQEAAPAGGGGGGGGGAETEAAGARRRPAGAGPQRAGGGRRRGRQAAAYCRGGGAVGPPRPPAAAAAAEAADADAAQGGAAAAAGDPAGQGRGGQDAAAGIRIGRGGAGRGHNHGQRKVEIFFRLRRAGGGAPVLDRECDAILVGLEFCEVDFPWTDELREVAPVVVYLVVV